MSGASSSKSKPSRRRFSARRLVRWILRTWLAVLIVLGGIVFWRGSHFASRQVGAEPKPVHFDNLGAMVDRLAVALRVRTVSDGKGQSASAELYALHEHLRESFPLIEAQLVRENVAELSLLYTWRGQDPSLPAIIVAAHLDVVPAIAFGWSHAPFAADLDAGYLYGRGSLDDKAALLASLEAVELLLEEGFVPQRTLYLAFGHDEEVGGTQGAKAIAELLKARGVEAEATLDEGMVIVEGIIDGIDKPVALIGIAEKGLLNLELVAMGEGGHSSMPPRETAVGVLSKAIVQLQEHPMPGEITDSVQQMLAYVGPEQGFGHKLIMANLWLFGRLVQGSLARKPATDALLRTTTAPTMLQGSSKSNVLAQVARAVVNFRIRPGDNKESVLAHAEKVIGDSRVALRGMEYSPPQSASSTHSRIFLLMQKTLRSIDKDIVVAPGLTVGITDSRYYAGISANTYRFTPLRLGPEDLARLHGADERIAIKNYAEVVAYDHRLLRAALGADLGPAP